MANEPLVVLRGAVAKVLLVHSRTVPILIKPSETTSVIIRRSDIPGAPGPQGNPGPPGPPSEATIPERLDGGNF